MEACAAVGQGLAVKSAASVGLSAVLSVEVTVELSVELLVEATGELAVELSVEVTASRNSIIFQIQAESHRRDTHTKIIPASLLQLLLWRQQIRHRIPLFKPRNGHKIRKHSVSLAFE